ncbi:lysis protein S [Shigella sonnei]|nr:lysis protein S [Shigella sonnei]
MEKISTGIAYGTSAGSAGYWFLQWLDQVSPSQWAAIGVLGSHKRKWICPYISRHLFEVYWQ